MSSLSQKLQRGITGRKGLSDRLLSIQTSKPIYWFQVASSGELEQCLPIVEELKARKDVYALITYFSPSAEKAIALESERRARLGLGVLWDHADYSPWDLPWIVSKVVSSLKPAAFIAIHREIWPNLLKALKKNRVKTYLLSTYWPPKSRKRLGFVRSWLSLFDFIGTVNEDSAAFLSGSLPGKTVKSLGDARIDRVLSRRKSTKDSALWNSFLPGNKIFVGASLWSEDFEALQEVIKECCRTWRFILVPHDPSSRVGEEIFAHLKRLQAPTRYWSSWIEDPDTTSHIIVNRVGFLAELYKVASIVLVGGSFKGRVHNVLEPAAYRCPILTGPYVWNSNEAVEMNRLGAGLKVCKDAGGLYSAFKTWATDEALHARDAQATLSYLEANQGAGKRYADVLVRHSFVDPDPTNAKR